MMRVLRFGLASRVLVGEGVPYAPAGHAWGVQDPYRISAGLRGAGGGSSIDNTTRDCFDPDCRSRLLLARRAVYCGMCGVWYDMTLWS